MLVAGDKAPIFALKDDNGEIVHLKDLLRSGPLILFFYPADFTPICTQEACMLRDKYDDLLDAGIQVVGINSHSARKHASFRSKHSLPFPLLVDPDREVARAYDARGLFGLWTKRITYWIDSDGSILDSVTGDLSLAPHREFVERVLSELRATSTTELLAH